MTRYTISLVLFYSILSSSWGQKGFSNKYATNGRSTFFDQILWIGGDTLVVYGLGFSQDTSLDTQGLFLSKIDTNGNVLDTHIYFDSLGGDYTIASPVSIVKLKDGSGYAILAQYFSRQSGVLLILDNNAAIKSISDFEDTTTFIGFYHRIIEDENCFYIAGEKQKKNYQKDLFVIRTDKKGNKLWEKSYGLSNREDYFGSFIIMDKNKFVIGSGTGSLMGTPLQQVKFTTKLFAIDSLGNIKWAWESPLSNNEGGVTGLYRSTDNYWCYTSGKGEYNAEKNTLFVQPKFIKRDSNFNIVFEKNIGILNSFYNRFYYSSPLSNNDWFATGSVLKDKKTLAGWMYRLNSTGDSLWSRMDTAQASGPIAGENYLISATELPSGSIVACGYSVRLDVGKYWGWLIKVDQNGCIDTLSCTPVSSTQVEKLAGRLKLYPNPAQALVHFADEDQIVWDKIEVVDAAGQVLSTLIKPTGNDIDLSGLGPGAYFIRFLKSDKYVVKPIIKL